MRPTVLKFEGRDLEVRTRKLGLTVGAMAAATELPAAEISAALQERIPIPFRLRIFISMYGSASPASRRAITRTIALDAHIPEIEDWRPIPGFPRYEASSLGNIRRAADLNGRPVGHILRPHVGDSGHLKVSVYNGKQKRAGVHQLVCLAFHGPAPAGKPFALHGDGNESNNRPDNLRWGTRAENADDARRHRAVVRRTRRGWRIWKKPPTRAKRV